MSKHDPKSKANRNDSRTLRLAYRRKSKRHSRKIRRSHDFHKNPDGA